MGARIRSVIDTLELSPGNAKDQRRKMCLAACESVVKVLNDIGLGFVLQTAQDKALNDLGYKRRLRAVDEDLDELARSTSGALGKPASAENIAGALQEADEKRKALEAEKVEKDRRTNAAWQRAVQEFRNQQMVAKRKSLEDENILRAREAEEARNKAEEEHKKAEELRLEHEAMKARAAEIEQEQKEREAQG